MLLLAFLMNFSQMKTALLRDVRVRKHKLKGHAWYR